MFTWEKRLRSVSRIQRQDELLHGEDGDMVFKYDLPVVNLPLKLKNELVVLEGEDAEPT